MLIDKTDFLVEYFLCHSMEVIEMIVFFFLEENQSRSSFCFVRFFAFCTDLNGSPLTQLTDLLQFRCMNSSSIYLNEKIKEKCRLKNRFIFFSSFFRIFFFRLILVSRQPNTNGRIEQWTNPEAMIERINVFFSLYFHPFLPEPRSFCFFGVFGAIFEWFRIEGENQRQLKRNDIHDEIDGRWTNVNRYDIYDVFVTFEKENTKKNRKAEKKHLIFLLIFFFFLLERTKSKNIVKSRKRAFTQFHCCA